MAFYIVEYYQHLQNFYLEEQENDFNKIIEDLVKIFNDTTKNVYINNGIILENFDKPLTTFIQNLNFTPESFQIIFKSAYNIAFKKFREHILTHPCHELFKAAQIFDPRFVNFTPTRDILFYSTSIIKFANPSYNLHQEWAIYCNFDLSLIEYSNLEEFWQKVSHNHLSLLSQIALDYIWMPLSSYS